MRISHELAIIWITSDGKKFLNKREALLHEKLEKGKWEKDIEEEEDPKLTEWIRERFKR